MASRLHIGPRSDPLRRTRRVAAGSCLALALISAQVVAGHTRFLLRDDTICDDEKRLCIEGTLLHHDLSNVILFIGRIERTTLPGRVVLRLGGTTPAGFREVVEFRFRVEGRYSEIIDQKMVPHTPSQTEWSISGFFYYPDSAAGS